MNTYLRSSGWQGKVVLTWYHVVIICIVLCLAGAGVALSGPGIWLGGFIGALSLAVSIASPSVGICLIAVGATLSDVLPRIGPMGGLELTLGMLMIVVALRSLLLRKRVKVDSFLAVMALVLFVFAMSMLADRGIEDPVRVYTWVGTCVCYFVVINLLDKPRAFPGVLLGYAFLTTGLLLLDFLFLSGTPLPQTEYEWAMYRSLGSSQGASGMLVGQANFVVSLATVFFPVFLVYGLFSRKPVLRLCCVVGMIGMVTLALLVQTQAFFLQAGVALMATLFPMIKRRSVLKSALLLAMLVALLWVTTQRLLPGGWGLLESRFVSGQSEGARFDIWVGLIVKGMESPVFGHGALGYDVILAQYGILSRHGLFPQLFFEYGMIGVVPIAILFLMWGRRSWETLQIVLRSDDDPRLALAFWGIFVGLLVNTVVNLHLVMTPSYACLAFVVAALQLSYLRSIRTTGGSLRVVSADEARVHLLSN